MELRVYDEHGMKAFGTRLGAMLMGGEVIELAGDVGAGKTTLVKAIAAGMGIEDDVGSPSYTLSQIYEAPYGLSLAHYDFYRLDDPGLMADALRETLTDGRVVTAIEWGDLVAGVVPYDHLQIRITPLSETARQLTVTAGGDISSNWLARLA
jgi:tRNA threonylcarbamoyladenosine biosynthesis protein TsaE